MLYNRIYSLVLLCVICRVKLANIYIETKSHYTPKTYPKFFITNTTLSVLAKIVKDSVVRAS